MTRVPMTQAVAADYADAMLVARRAKNVLFMFLTLILLAQLAIFFVAKYVPSLKMRIDITTATTESGTSTSSSTDVHAIERKPGEGSNRLWSPLLEYIIPVIDFCGLVFAVVLPVVLLLILTIMLVGRLVGVSHVTSAFCWSIVFLVILFPWQSLLNSGSGYASTQAGASSSSTAVTPAADMPDIRIPGVLYTFPELRRDYDFPNMPMKVAVLKWSRFVGFPLVELILLLIIQGRSSRGLRFALGETELPSLDYGSTVQSETGARSM